jgi:hypothetical protein
MDEVSFLEVVRAFYDNDVFVALPGGLKVVDRVSMAMAGYLSTWIVRPKKKSCWMSRGILYTMLYKHFPSKSRLMLADYELHQGTDWR